MSEYPYDVNSIPPYEEMMTFPAVSIPTASIHPTQPVLMIDRILALHRGEPTEGPDPCPHVVNVGGRFYVHNGHHRWIVALLRGDMMMDVRVSYE
jgi:hypothetical protein